MMRRLVGRFCALVFFLFSAGRVRGRRFIWMPPFTLKIERGGRLTIGNDVMIARGARVAVRATDLKISDSVFISQNVTLVAYAPLSIGTGTLIGENCSVHTENHGPAGKRDQFTNFPITIGNEAWLGSGVAVLPGATIGAGTVVGANAVVRGELIDGGTYVGVPVRRVR
ncbi:acyltransferase [Microbacterium aerolatum]|uniref:acyltransferase n=1 Tax=Microbacterium aerolatum TaxID=153731 RepID=UPI0020019BBB|nr:acyltransferase [Microbacterium aerolatum]MCK3769963.1 acyltransferase [Microbacterium aerolatum]